MPIFTRFDGGARGTSSEISVEHPPINIRACEEPLRETTRLVSSQTHPRRQRQYAHQPRTGMERRKDDLHGYEFGVIWRIMTPMPHRAN